MGIKNKIVEMRDNYVIKQVAKLELPEFEPDKKRRYLVIFSGRVQNVGFRLEISELAKRLELTGYCTNLENGDVMVELQGPKNKIKYLVSFMYSLRRIKIKSRTVVRLDVIHEEESFEMIEREEDDDIEVMEAFDAMGEIEAMDGKE